MWSTPRHGTARACTTRKVCGSLKSSRPSRSAASIANRAWQLGERNGWAFDGNGAAGPRSSRIDRRDRVSLVVQHVQRLQVPCGRDVLRQGADRELLDDLHASRVDHVDRVALAVRDVDTRECASRGAAEHVRAVRCVDVEGRHRAGACRACRAGAGESEHLRLRPVRAPAAGALETRPLSLRTSRTI